MARGIRVRINSAGARDVLTSAGVLADLTARGEAIASEACARTSDDELENPPYMAADDSDEARARVSVYTSSPHGIRNNNKYNTLLNSIDAGR